MKKIYAFVAFACLTFAACSNDKTVHKGESGPNMTNVENVNGNVPDTSSGAVLNNKPTPDSSSLRDSIR